MNMRQANWVVVLAAGDGTRLSALTTDERGATVPKQFCSLNGGPTLLQVALQRARRIVPRERVCALVARRHERHWRRLPSSLPTENVIVQPRNCGTANGVLLGLLHILERDPLARITFLPADHYVRNEAMFAAAVRSAATRTAARRDGITLVGIEPDDVDPDLGYIVPGGMLFDGTRRVEQFAEKPAPAAARDLVARGAVWNSFIFWAHASALLALIRRRLPEIAEDMANALARDWRHVGSPFALAELYDRLPVVDFSRSVVQGAESELSVSTIPRCGWTDLGTPGRVGKTVQRLRADPAVWSSDAAAAARASVDLAASLDRFSAAFGSASDTVRRVL